MKDRIIRVLGKIPLIRRMLQKAIDRRRKKKLEARINTIREKGVYVVKEIEDALSQSEVTYFATCGTLLGLIRENQLLKNDYDLDYAVLIEEAKDWLKVEHALVNSGFKLIRFFTLDGMVTEQTYTNADGIEIDFFGHFMIDNEICFFSYDKLENIQYPNEQCWSTYILKNGQYKGVKRIITDIGMVTVPENAEEYLSYNYNDNWRVPDPGFKANTGKGCRYLPGKVGIITEL